MISCRKYTAKEELVGTLRNHAVVDLVYVGMWSMEEKSSV